MNDMTKYDEPLTGIQVAQLSWDLPDGLLQQLLLNIPQDTAVYDDVRSQFALWAATQPNARFSDLSEAWNLFIAPRGGLTHPAVLLPGSSCSRCHRFRLQGRSLAKGKQPACPECRGTGRKTPRAIYAAYSRVAPVTHLLEADAATGT